MAKIREYTNEAGLKPVTAGVDALAGLARDTATAGYRIGQMIKGTGNEIEGAVKTAGRVAGEVYEERVIQPEISNGAVLAATKLNELTAEWNKLAAGTDANDSTIAEKFRRDRIEPELAKLKDGFFSQEGQKWAEDRVLKLTDHFNDKLTADTAYRSGLAAKQKVETLENTHTNNVMRDPSAYEFTLDLAKADIRSIVANTSGLNAQTAAQLTTTLEQNMGKKIAQAALVGTAEKNPDKAEADLRDGKYSKYLDGVEEFKAIQTLKRAQRADAALARQETERAKKAISEATQLEYLQKLRSEDPAVRASVSVVGALRDKRFDLDGAKYLVGVMDARAQRGSGTDVPSNPNAYDSLAARVFSSDNPLTVNDILKANLSKNPDEKINDKDRDTLLAIHEKADGALFKSAIMQDVMKTAEAKITWEVVNMPGKDSIGRAKLTAFRIDWQREYQQRVRDGKAMPNDLNPADPTSFVSQIIKRHERSLQEQMEDKSRVFKAMGLNPGGGTGVGGRADAPRIEAPSQNVLDWMKTKNITNYDYDRQKRVRDLDTGNIYKEDGTLLVKGKGKVGQ